MPCDTRHLMRSSGRCVSILASNSLVLPQIFVANETVHSSSCVTRVTRCMNVGQSSNCVHWLYAVSIGTATSTDCCTGIRRPFPTPGMPPFPPPPSSPPPKGRIPLAASFTSPPAPPASSTFELTMSFICAPTRSLALDAAFAEHLGRRGRHRPRADRVDALLGKRHHRRQARARGEPRRAGKAAVALLLRIRFRVAEVLDGVACDVGDDVPDRTTSSPSPLCLPQIEFWRRPTQLGGHRNRRNASFSGRDLDNATPDS